LFLTGGSCEVDGVTVDELIVGDVGAVQGESWDDVQTLLVDI
jgi:hypothetical protein